MMNVKNYNVVEKLKNGRDVFIRAVRPSDKETLIESMSLYSDETLYRRFFTFKRSFNEKELNYFTEVDFVSSVQLVVELSEMQNKLVGGCRYIAADTANSPQQAEIAFIVSDDLQGKGLGKILFRHLINIGKANGIKRFEAVVLAGNKGMERVFSGSGLAVNKRNEGREIYFDIDLLSKNIT